MLTLCVFVRLSFVAVINYENIFTMKISRLMVHAHACTSTYMYYLWSMLPPQYNVYITFASQAPPKRHTLFSTYLAEYSNRP